MSDSPRTTTELQWLGRVLGDRTILALMIVLFGGVGVTLWWLSDVADDLHHQAAIDEAAGLSTALLQFRSLYTSEVVERALPHGILVTHDYEQRPGAIPLPATLSMLLAKRVADVTDGGTVRLYSDYPFPFRTDGGPHDGFEEEALRQLRTNPDQPFVRVEPFNGQPALRYATADLMQSSCVDCHNSHPDSPKTNWQVGDVRGVLEVVQPLGLVGAYTDLKLRNTFVLMMTLALLGFATLLFFIVRTRGKIEALATAPAGTIALAMERQDAPVTAGTRTRLLLLAAALSIGIFALDLSTPLGVAAGVPYVLVVLLSLWSHRRVDAYWAATVGTILTVIGLVLSPEGGEIWKVLANRFLAVFAIWVTAILCVWQIRRTAEQTRLQAEKVMAEEHFLALREAKEAAESANRTKSAFLANMSHELRTPLHGIMGFTHLLMEEVNDRKLQSLAPDLQQIQSAGNHLLELISDILDVSRIEAGRMTLVMEPFDVGELMDDVTRTIQPLVDKSGNRLKTTYPKDLKPLTADRIRTRQILLNLLSNANKFTHGGRIAMTVRPVILDGREWYEFHVTDTGIGMTAEQAEHVFDEFVQVDDTSTRQYGGTGLGLAITKKLCSAMGGDLRLKTEPNRGSTFTIRLPVPDLKREA